jgi:dihydrofolate reductase
VSFVSSLIQAQLVDEYFLLINPSILGKGKSIYRNVVANQALKLKSATAYKCGVVLLHYLKG